MTSVLNTCMENWIAFVMLFSQTHSCSVCAFMHRLCREGGERERERVNCYVTAFLHRLCQDGREEIFMSRRERGVFYVTTFPHTLCEEGRERERERERENKWLRHCFPAQILSRRERGNFYVSFPA